MVWEARVLADDEIEDRLEKMESRVWLGWHNIFIPPWGSLVTLNRCDHVAWSTAMRQYWRWWQRVASLVYYLYP
jgi:hypothetical protein